MAAKCLYQPLHSFFHKTPAVSDRYPQSRFPINHKRHGQHVDSQPFCLSLGNSAVAVCHNRCSHLHPPVGSPVFPNADSVPLLLSRLAAFKSILSYYSVKMEALQGKLFFLQNLPAVWAKKLMAFCSSVTAEATSFFTSSSADKLNWLSSLWKKSLALRRRTILSTRPFIYHISVSGKLSLYLHSSKCKEESQ